MSETSNYTAETKPLFKLLRTEAFRFIPVKYDNYALIELLVSDLKKQYPQRTVKVLDGSKTDYRELMDTYFSIDTGFLFIENFDQVLAEPAIYQGLNQRRDKLAQQPNAIFALMPSSTGDKWARPIMEKMPDLWSFRSYLLELETDWANSEHEIKTKEGIHQSNRLVISHITIEVEEIPDDEIIKTSTIGGRSSKEKRQNIQRILTEIKSTPLEETELLKKLYWQIFKLYDDIRDFKKALSVLEQLKPLMQKKSEKANWLRNYGKINYLLSQFDDAISCYNKALSIYRKLVMQHREKFMPEVAKTLNNLANLYRDKNELEKAEMGYIEALQIRKQIADQNPEEYLPDVAASHNNLAILLTIKNELEKAEKSHIEALEIRKKLANANPESYLPDVSMTLHNLAILQKDKNDLKRAEKYINEALELREEFAKENPDVFLPDLALTLNSLANLYKKKNEWKKAEQEYIKAFNLHKQLAKKNSKVYSPNLGMVSLNLAILYHEHQPNKVKSASFLKEAVLALKSFVDTLPRAKEYFERAIQILQDLEVNPQEFLKELGIQYPLEDR